ncbi:hypothetical protein [Thermococcus peptonophilus]|uniref:hypothetical protein n=1 Tax=Thermococcus peptonophilus TaxID=53952 RepID=UPI000A99B609
MNPGFEGELEDKINEIMDVADIDYIVMNHAEPDHSARFRTCWRGMKRPFWLRRRRART